MSSHGEKRVLFISAKPRDQQFVRCRDEFQSIRAISASPVAVTELHIDDLLGALSTHKPQIIHFCGHGTEEGLFLLDNEDNSNLILNDTLVRNFFLMHEYLECIVINACFSTPIVEKLSRGVRCVIGWSHLLQDDAAVAFTNGFYSALMAGLPPNQAFQFGRTAISNKGIEAFNIPIIRCNVKRKEIHPMIKGYMDETYKKCLNAKVPFRTPHLFQSISNSTDVIDIKSRFDRSHPGLYDQLSNACEMYINNHRIPKTEIPLFPFEWFDRNYILAANSEAVFEDAAFITARHLILGILLSETSVAKKTKKLLDPPSFNSLISSLRDPYVIDHTTSI